MQKQKHSDLRTELRTAAQAFVAQSVAFQERFSLAAWDSVTAAHAQEASKVREQLDKREAAVHEAEAALEALEQQARACSAEQGTVTGWHCRCAAKTPPDTFNLHLHGSHVE